MNNFRASRREAPSLQPGMLTVSRGLDRLNPDPAIARRHGKQRNREIANLLKPPGFNLPIRIDRIGRGILDADRIAS